MPDPARRLSLPPAGDIDVWWWPLDVTAADVAGLRALLAPDELARAGRFLRPLDGTRFVVAHAGLREVLAAYAGLPAPSLAFAAAAHGKPALAGEGRSAAPGLRFSLSHSGGVAAVAVCEGAEVGLDIEAVRPVERDVASASFAPAELAELAVLPPGEWLAGFYRCWTRREAVLKASGQGLGGPPGDLVVSTTAGSSRIVHAAGVLEGAERWSLLPFALAPDLPGAVVLASHAPARIRSLERWERPTP